MSTDDYATMSTERLLELFVETAKQLGSVYPEWPKVLTSGLPEMMKRTPERVERLAKIRAVATALAARKPIAEVRRLFEDDDRDVRAWASGQFRGIDPERASASLAGLFTNLSTQEVLAQQRLARQRPPPRPTLKDMSDDALVARFEDAATREDATQFLDCTGERKDMAVRNRIVGEVLDIMRELKSRGLLGRLLPLLASPKVAVRYEAAQACLRIAPQQASEVIEAIVASNDPDFLLRASQALELWRQGKSPVHGL